MCGLKNKNLEPGDRGLSNSLLSQPHRVWLSFLKQWKPSTRISQVNFSYNILCLYPCFLKIQCLQQKKKKKSQMNTLLASAVPGKLEGGEKEMRPERSLREGRGQAKKQVVCFAGEEAAGSPLVLPRGERKTLPSAPILDCPVGTSHIRPHEVLAPLNFQIIYVGVPSGSCKSTGKLGGTEIWLRDGGKHCQVKLEPREEPGVAPMTTDRQSLCWGCLDQIQRQARSCVWHRGRTWYILQLQISNLSV